MNNFHAGSPLAQLEARAERHVSSADRQLCVWRKWGQGPSLILLHGGFGSWNHWCRNIEPLSREFTVIAPDLPGLGDSDAIAGENIGVTEIADTLERGLDELLEPDERFQVGCFSFGAIAGSELAVRFGGRVGSFTLIGAAGFGARERPTDGMVRIREEMTVEEKREAARLNLEILMFADPAKVDDQAVDIQLENTRRARFRSRPLSLSDTVLRNLPAISASRNAIWGSADATAVGKLEERNAAILEADPDAEIVMFEGGGHWIQYEAAEAFNDAYLKILRRHA